MLRQYRVFSRFKPFFKSQRPGTSPYAARSFRASPGNKGVCHLCGRCVRINVKDVFIPEFRSFPVIIISQSDKQAATGSYCQKCRGTYYQYSFLLHILLFPKQYHLPFLQLCTAVQSVNLHKTFHFHRIPLGDIPQRLPSFSHVFVDLTCRTRLFGL